MAESFLERLIPWHKLPRLVGLLRLNRIRERLREENLHDTDRLPAVARPPLPPPTPEQKAMRTADGTYNDLGSPRMGSAGARFGRNIPLDRVVTEDKAALLTPSPRTVSLELMTRRQFQPATSLNLFAAAWIQFQVHDWFSHGHNEKENPIEIPLKEDDPWPERPMTVRRTGRDRTRPPDEAGATSKIPSFTNTETHWWDGSQLYGSDQATQNLVRSFEDGRLKIGDDGLLPVDPQTGVDVTGVSGNWWVGLSLLHTVFTREHNAVCERLRAAHPQMNDEELFRRARLVTAAVMAKIHTVEWTPAILAHPTVGAGMRDNWRRIRRSKAEHHAAPYSLTEEFVAVYRMHPLMPDEFTFRSLASGQIIDQRTLPGVAGRHAREVMNRVALSDLCYSFGVSHPGAITLHNYPRFLQTLVREDGPTLDLAAVDILRDRERGVPRYNEFRKLINRDPVEKFEDLSDNKDWCEEIRRVYDNDINKVDLMVGMFAEPLIKGFGFSETAFRIFILMASRRLQSDRFFTDGYTEQNYTRAGLDWIEEATMASVLQRHVPALKPLLQKVENAFAPWPSA
jgi:hypothetical protein